MTGGCRSPRSGAVRARHNACAGQRFFEWRDDDPGISRRKPVGPDRPAAAGTRLGRRAGASGRSRPSAAVRPACRWCVADGAGDWRGVGSSAGRSRPLRPMTRQKQPRVKARAVRGLEIVNPVEGAIAQGAAQRQPSRNVERPGPAIDGDLSRKVRSAARGRQSRGWSAR